MINENIFIELERNLKDKGYEVLNNEKSKMYFQFIYGDETFKIDKNSGLIFPDVPNMLDDDGTKKVSFALVEKWNEIIGIIHIILEKLNIDIEYPFPLNEFEEKCIDNKTYILILKYNNVYLFYRDHGFLGISYHVFSKSGAYDKVFYDDENVSYNIRDAISLFSDRSSINEILKLQNNSTFSLSELKTIIFLLSNIKNITNGQKEDVKSFVKKATNIIKLKSNVDI